VTDPFHEIVLDLPAPPSVNKLRKIDWWQHKRAEKWKRAADGHVLVAKVRSDSPIKLNRVPRFELRIILSEHHTKQDLDNSLKCLIDYLRHIELIADDAQRNMRKVSVEWGIAPEGCRVFVKPCT
jgi:Holliday junction resolvase RusA-like endonuclease